MNFTHFVEPERLVRRSCVDAGVSYEDRVARRKEEIESLQEALRILNGKDPRLDGTVFHEIVA